MRRRRIVYLYQHAVSDADGLLRGVHSYGCYTTDGSAPWYNGSTCGGTGTHYTGAFNITATTTIKYIFCATNYSCSTPETTTYTINTGAALVSVETWSCAGACASHTIGTGTCLVGAALPWLPGIGSIFSARI